MTLRVVPITVRTALPWVREHHSHLDRPNGGILAAAVESDLAPCICPTDKSDASPYCSCLITPPEWRLCCVALADHPARLLMDGFTLNVSRVCSDGTAPHAASKCLAAISRAALALGYTRLCSYLLIGEHGTSYRAAGWWAVAVSEGGEWDRPSRRRGGAAQPGEKVRWEFGPSALPPHLCVTCGQDRATHDEPSTSACAHYHDIDVYVREHAGRVPLRGRHENMPLFGGGVS